MEESILGQVGGGVAMSERGDVDRGIVMRESKWRVVFGFRSDLLLHYVYIICTLCVACTST